MVASYIRSCPVCVFPKPSRRLPVGELQLIDSPTVPSTVQTLGFIVGLPQTRTEDNAILTATDKFTKAVIYPGKGRPTMQENGLFHIRLLTVGSAGHYHLRPGS